MDSRTKIVSAAQAAQNLPPVIVRGFFDPLTAAHVRRLEHLAGAAGAVTVLVVEGEGLLLSARARAELVAALSVVRNVVIADAIPREFQALTIADELEGDLERARQLRAHVHGRQNAN